MRFRSCGRNLGWRTTQQGKIIRKEEEGIRILVDLEKRDRADAIQAIEDVLSQLER